MEIRLDGKAAIVTGGSRGIGRGIAEALAGSGADVTIAYHGNAAAAEETVAALRALGRSAIAVQADVADEQAVERLFAAHQAAFGRLDILVNNAGVGGHSLIHETSTEEWMRVVGTNLFGPFFCSRLAGRMMIESRTQGRIINITSVHEESCWAGAGPYCVSKGGLRNLTRTQAIELGPHGITVNVIAPGMTLTDMQTRVASDDTYLGQAEAQIVMRRAGLPSDIGHMAVFLASDFASYITGVTHYVDGGWMLTWPPV